MSTDKRRKKVTRLTGLDANEVSLVPVGANMRKFLVTKSFDGEETMEKILKQILEGKLEGEAQIDEVLKQAKLSPEQEKTVKGAIRLLSSVKGMVPGEVMSKLAEMVGMPYGENKKKQATRKELLEELRKEGYKVEEPKKEEPKMDGETKKFLDDIKKEHSEALDKIRKENSDLHEALNKERNLRVMKELVSKAEGFGYRGEEAQKIAKSLKSASDKLSEDEYKEFEAVVKSNAKRENVTDLFKEHGSTQGDPNGQGYTPRIDAVKAEIRKSHPDWSDAKVEDEALVRNPELYNEYLNENPKQGGY